MTITVTADNALLAINRFISSIASDFPEPEAMYSIETEVKAGKEEIRVYSFEELQGLMAKPICPETRAPLNLLTFSPCGKLFALVLAIAEASGRLETAIQTAIKRKDDLETFAATSDFRKALVEGRGILDSLLKAPGDIKAKMLAVGLPVNDSIGQIRLLTHTLGFKPEEFVGYKHPGKGLPAYLPPLAAKTEALIPPVAIHLAQNAMPDPFSPFTPAIGAAPNAAVYNEQAEIKRVMEASMQDNEGADLTAALLASLHVQAPPQDEDAEFALAMAVSLQAQVPVQDEDDDDFAQALAASLGEVKVSAEDALAMRLNQAQQAYEGGEYKNQADANEGFLARLDMGMRINIANNDILLLRRMLEQIERKVEEALEQNNADFVGALFERSARIQAHIDGGQAIRAVPVAQQPAMLPAARAAGVGLNAAPNRAVNPPVLPPVVVVPLPAAAPAVVPPAAPVARPAPAEVFAPTFGNGFNITF